MIVWSLYLFFVEIGSSIGKYNGNITEVTWKTASDQVLRQYNYSMMPLTDLKKESILNREPLFHRTDSLMKP
ncbi:hypothetical protein [Chryseobacterium pyrolae]|uniref:hypothetical protein n=1 Tax=Chryseobacterium pyrolae TaxID=2987481 RepID=UPI00311B074C